MDNYKKIVCPECKRNIILLELDKESHIDGRIRIKCRSCKEYFIVSDEGLIVNEKIVMRQDDYKSLML